MPSPAGHLIAGVAIAWAAECFPPLRPRARANNSHTGPVPAITPLVLACGALALAPDLDILLATHRTYTHSIAAVALAALACGAIAGGRAAPAGATGFTCGLVVASHIVLDWLGRDSSTPSGIMAFWPVSTAHFYSGIDLFADISRRYWKPEEFIIENAVSMAREFVILAPAAGLAFWLRRRWTEGKSGVRRCSATSESRVPNPESRL
jgi:membrane-bound metal-dependent hydrolase YbcI (DUF457 family)